MEHPFLDDAIEVQWTKMTAEKVIPDIDVALASANAQLEAICKLTPAELSYENVFHQFWEAKKQVAQAWNRINHLNSLCNSPERREAIQQRLGDVSAFFGGLYLNQALWTVVSQAAEVCSDLDSVRNRHVTETVRSFKQNGADLPSSDRERLADLDRQLAELTQKFSNNVLDDTEAYVRVVTDANELAGIPESAIEVARQTALSREDLADTEAWVFTLHMPSYLAVLTHAESEVLRKDMWSARSQIGRGERDNLALVREILSARARKAKMLGFSHFSDFVLSRRMAKSGAQAKQFVEQLHSDVVQFFDREIQQLEGFWAEHTAAETVPLAAWDWPYAANLMRQQLHQFDDELLKPYFEIDTVMAGLFELVVELFGVRVVERSTIHHSVGDSSPVVDVWHESVKAYDLFEGDKRIGFFYTDWFPRAGKRGGAWMNGLSTASRRGAETAPHVGVICGNFSPPAGDQPALLRHREVQTIFHEFGHLLHHLLSDVSVPELSGANVAWDFVELPSQIMENWCWERPALDRFAKHVDTGVAIPSEMFERLLSSRNFLSGVGFSRQLASTSAVALLD